MSSKKLKEQNSIADKTNCVPSNTNIQSLQNSQLNFTLGSYNSQNIIDSQKFQIINNCISSSERHQEKDDSFGQNQSFNKQNQIKNQNQNQIRDSTFIKANQIILSPTNLKSQNKKQNLPLNNQIDSAEKDEIKVEKREAKQSPKSEIKNYREASLSKIKEENDIKGSQIFIQSNFQTNKNNYNQSIPYKSKISTPCQNYSRGTSYQKSNYHNLMNKTNVFSCEREKNLQDNIRQIKKLLHQKECDFQRDKAIWIQRCELAEKGMQELRIQMETQKSSYIQLLKSIKLNDSPLKINMIGQYQQLLQNSQDIKFTYYEQSNEQSSSKSQNQYLNTPPRDERKNLIKENIEQILLQEQVQQEIEKKSRMIGEEKAFEISKEQINKLNNQILQFEEQIRINEQYQIEYDAKLQETRNILRDKENIISNQLQQNLDQQHIIDTLNQKLIQVKKENETIIQQQLIKNECLHKIQEDLKELIRINEELKLQNVTAEKNENLLVEDNQNLQQKTQSFEKFIEKLRDDQKELQEYCNSLEMAVKKARSQNSPQLASKFQQQTNILLESISKQNRSDYFENFNKEIQKLQMNFNQQLKDKENQIKQIKEQQESIFRTLQVEMIEKDMKILQLSQDQRKNQNLAMMQTTVGSKLQRQLQRMKREENQIENMNDKSFSEQRDSIMELFKSSIISNQNLEKIECLNNFKRSGIFIEFPSFSNDIVGHQIQVLNTKVNGAIVENNEKVLVTPVSAGLPQLKKLDQKMENDQDNHLIEYNQNTDQQQIGTQLQIKHIKLDLQEMANQANDQEDQKKEVVQQQNNKVLQLIDNSPYFISQNFTQNETKFAEIHEELSEEFGESFQRIVNIEESQKYIIKKEELSNFFNQKQRNILIENQNENDQSYLENQKQILNQELRNQFILQNIDQNLQNSKVNNFDHSEVKQMQNLQEQNQYSKSNNDLQTVQKINNYLQNEQLFETIKQKKDEEDKNKKSKQGEQETPKKKVEDMEKCRMSYMTDVLNNRDFSRNLKNCSISDVSTIQQTTATVYLIDQYDENQSMLRKHGQYKSNQDQSLQILINDLDEQTDHLLQDRIKFINDDQDFSHEYLLNYNHTIDQNLLQNKIVFQNEQNQKYDQNAELNIKQQISDNFYGSSVLSTNGLNESSGPLRMIFEKNLPEQIIVESAQGMKHSISSSILDNEKKLFTFQKQRPSKKLQICQNQKDIQCQESPSPFNSENVELTTEEFQQEKVIELIESFQQHSKNKKLFNQKQEPKTSRDHYQNQSSEKKFNTLLTFQQNLQNNDLITTKLNMLCSQKKSPKETFVPKIGIAANIPIQSPKKNLVNGLNTLKKTQTQNTLLQDIQVTRSQNLSNTRQLLFQGRNKKIEQLQQNNKDNLGILSSSLNYDQQKQFQTYSSKTLKTFKIQLDQTNKQSQNQSPLSNKNTTMTSSNSQRQIILNVQNMKNDKKVQYNSQRTLLAPQNSNISKQNLQSETIYKKNQQTNQLNSQKEFEVSQKVQINNKDVNICGLSIQKDTHLDKYFTHKKNQDEIIMIQNQLDEKKDDKKGMLRVHSGSTRKKWNFTNTQVKEKQEIVDQKFIISKNHNIIEKKIISKFDLEKLQNAIDSAQF